MKIECHRILLCLLLALLLPVLLSVSAKGEEIRYHIDAELDEGGRLLKAHQLVLVRNWARVPLDRLYFHLFPNDFRAVEASELRDLSRNLNSFEDPLRAFPRGTDGGYMQIDTVLVDGQIAEHTVRGTWMEVFLPTALPPQEQVKVEIGFCTKIPHVNSYLGYWKGIYTMAGWYPQLAFLTPHGWLYEEEVDVQESLANFADYRVCLRLPAGMVVAATGCLQRSTQEQGGISVQTWRARHVRYFGWVGSSRFLVSTISAQGVLVSSFYLPEHQKKGRLAGTYARQALLFYGARLGPYPRDQYAVVETYLPAAGLSLPGLCLIGSSLYDLGSFSDLLEWTIAHEVAHQWWAEKVDAREPWFCEGFAQFWGLACLRAHHGGDGWLIKGKFLSAIMPPIPLSWLNWVLYLNLARLGMEDKMTLMSTQFRESLSYQAAVYAKAPLVLQMLSDLLGNDGFLIFCRRLLAQPDHTVVTTTQVIRLASEIAGRDMGWFFHQWFESTERCDYAIDKMSCRRVGQGYETRLRLSRKGYATMPAEVTLTLRDGTRLRQRWDGKTHEHEVLFSSASSAQTASLNTKHQVLDLRPFNNFYPRKTPLEIALWPSPGIKPQVLSWQISPRFHCSSSGKVEVGLGLATKGLNVLTDPYFSRGEQGFQSEFLYRRRPERWSWQVGYSARAPFLGSRTLAGARYSSQGGEGDVEGTVRWIWSPFLFRSPYHVLKVKGRYEESRQNFRLRVDFLMDQRRTTFFPTFGNLYLLTWERGFSPRSNWFSYSRFSLEFWHHRLLLGNWRSAVRLFGGILVGSSPQKAKFDLQEHARLDGLEKKGGWGDGCLAVDQEVRRSLRGFLDLALFARWGLVWQRDGLREEVCQLGIGLRFLGNSPIAIQIDLPLATRDLRKKDATWRWGWNFRLGSQPRGL